MPADEHTLMEHAQVDEGQGAVATPGPAVEDNAHDALPNTGRRAMWPTGAACAPPPPAPKWPANPPVLAHERTARASLDWWCAGCCTWWNVPYRHPRGPDAVCARCDAVLDPDERLVAVLRALLRAVRHRDRAASATPTAPAAARVPAAPLREDGVLTPEEVAALLGCTLKAVYARASRGQLPGGFKLGRTLRFRARELVPFLTEGRAPSPKGSRR